MSFSEYLHQIERELRSGVAREHAYRPALKSLLESLAPGVSAINEPARSDFGAIDFVVSRGASVPVGYVEAKDIGENLDRIERSPQLKRYRDALPNLILTDYLEFRWYLDGDLRKAARLGTVEAHNRVRPSRGGQAEVSALLEGFFAQSPPKTDDPGRLAGRMAELAHLLREEVLSVLGQESPGGNLHEQLRAFQRTLLPDLRREEFADMYAQTITYGLFAARIASPDGARFTRYDAPRLLPRTNPFLRSLFTEIAGPDLDERAAWVVDALAALLSVADMEAILRDFGRRTRREDPVVHFYEDFLATYDPRTREMRGVYYTPEPVVSFIVRSVDALLRSGFGKPQGLADQETIVLEPALGTGTFLYYVINEVYGRFTRNRGAWPGYVHDHLIPRLFGFELLMAPYTMAHLKLGLRLQETGYEARRSDERLNVYLTNTLAEGVEAPQIPFAGYISEEANAAASIKRDEPIMVVLGNPPYSGHSANASRTREGQLTWIGTLVQDYYRVDGRPLGERNPKWLQDDYVKFIRFGQWRIDRTGRGVLAFITNHSYLDNPTFRGMRQSLMSSFSRIYLLDLHGNARKREVAPDGGPDENVFDIQQGAAIGLFVKEPGATGPARVYHAELWGEREAKYRALAELDVDSTDWTEIHPKSPDYLFKPRDVDLYAEYQQGWKVTDAMPLNSVGIVTSRDDFVFDFDENVLRRRISDFLNPVRTDAELREKYLSPRDKLPIASARAQLRASSPVERDFTRCLYRPFDVRALFYNDAVIERSRREVMRHMLGGGGGTLAWIFAVR